jgi:hypothetical protein
VDQCDGNGVAAVATLHRRGAVIRVDHPHVILASLQAGLFAEKAPGGESAEKVLADDPFGFVVGGTMADLAAWAVGSGALLE